MHAAIKSCSSTGAKPCGSTARMDEEARDQVVALLTRIGMMAEDLSAIALGAADVSGEELTGLIAEIQRMLLAMEKLSERAAYLACSGYSG